MVEGEGLGSWTGWRPCHGIVVGGKVMRWRRYLVRRIRWSGGTDRRVAGGIMGV